MLSYMLKGAGEYLLHPVMAKPQGMTHLRRDKAGVEFPSLLSMSFRAVSNARPPLVSCKPGRRITSIMRAVVLRPGPRALGKPVTPGENYQLRTYGKEIRL